MKQSTEEKLAATQEMYPPKIIELLDIGTTSLRKETSVDVDQALFQPFPSEVTFQQFEPHQAYQFPLQLRNLDKVARNIKVTSEESPYFTVNCQKPAGSKVAPGMEITFTVIFTPDEKKVQKLTKKFLQYLMFMICYFHLNFCILRLKILHVACVSCWIYFKLFILLLSGLQL